MERDLRDRIVMRVVAHNTPRVPHIEEMHIAVARARSHQRVHGVDGDRVDLSMSRPGRQHGVGGRGVERGVEGGVSETWIEGGDQLLRGDVEHGNTSCVSDSQTTSHPTSVRRTDSTRCSRCSRSTSRRRARCRRRQQGRTRCVLPLTRRLCPHHSPCRDPSRTRSRSPKTATD